MQYLTLQVVSRYVGSSCIPWGTVLTFCSCSLLRSPYGIFHSYQGNDSLSVEREREKEREREEMYFIIKPQKIV